MVKTKLDNNQVWDAFNLNGLFGEIKEIIEDKKTDGYIEFQESEFKTHLQRLHSYVKQFLQKLDGKKVRFTYQKPFNEIANYASRFDWLRLLDIIRMAQSL